MSGFWCGDIRSRWSRSVTGGSACDSPPAKGVAYAQSVLLALPIRFCYRRLLNPFTVSRDDDATDPVRPGGRSAPMLYKTIALELLESHPALHRHLRLSRKLLSELAASPGAT